MIRLPQRTRRTQSVFKLFFIGLLTGKNPISKLKNNSMGLDACPNCWEEQ
jgi:hypothetical protein